MKRSEINAALKEMEEMVNKCCFKLPPFCHFTPEDWKEKGSEYDEIRDNMLGWDITDYGLGRFDEVGFSLITLRNGKPENERQIYKDLCREAAVHKRGTDGPHALPLEQDGGYYKQRRGQCPDPCI